jgi:hypothetical protein
MTGLLSLFLAAGGQVRAVARRGPWGECDNETDLRLYRQDFAQGLFV